LITALGSTTSAKTSAHRWAGIGFLAFGALLVVGGLAVAPERPPRPSPSSYTTPRNWRDRRESPDSLATSAGTGGAPFAQSDSEADGTALATVGGRGGVVLHDRIAAGYLGCSAGRCDAPGKGSVAPPLHQGIARCFSLSPGTPLAVAGCRGDSPTVRSLHGWRDARPAALARLAHGATLA
jgi:hypothetical protein